MCGIACVYGEHPQGKILLEILDTLKHRGDKNREYKILDRCALGTDRLAITDRDRAIQPIGNEDGTVFVVFNGEIYNFEKLRGGLKNHTFNTGSDTEVLVHGYEEWGTGICGRLDGQFAFVVYDSKANSIFAARDPFGIKPLYYAYVNEASVFSSEIKGLASLQCDEIYELKPGHYFFNKQQHQYFKLDGKFTNQDIGYAKSRIRTLFEEAVKKRVQTDLPIAVFVSGGIDSSLVLKYAKKHHPNVTAFCAGEKGSSDLKFAKVAADYVGVKLEIFDPKNIDVAKELSSFIYAAETFEPNLINTIGLSYHIAKLAHDRGIKIALVGEGADEIFAGYSEFTKLKDKNVLQEALLLYVQLLHRTQLQRVDRGSMAHQVEARVPFLDNILVEYVMTIDPALKIRNGTTKWILREAFRGELPEEIIAREKVPFPVGAGAPRKEFEEDVYRKTAEKHLSYKSFRELRARYPEYKLETKEEAYYFSIYKAHFLKAAFNQERLPVKAR
jgi:asparagine synthase (glutamine-hydrolysing)